MKKTVILALSLLIILGLAYGGYSYLSERYSPSRPAITRTEKAEPEESVSAEEISLEEPEVPAEETQAEESPTDETAEEDTAPADMAADFSVLDWDGNTVSLSDYYGKPIVVNFWATWCGPCRSELPAFQTAYETYGDQIHFLMVNLTDGSYDTVETVKEFAESNGFSFPIFFDTAYEASDAYGISAIPFSLFIDKNGCIAAQQIGSMDESTLQAYIELLLE